MTNCTFNSEGIWGRMEGNHGCQRSSASEPPENDPEDPSEAALDEEPRRCTWKDKTCGGLGKSYSLRSLRRI